MLVATLGVALAVDPQRPVISLNFDESMILKKYPSPLSQSPHPKEVPAGKLPSDTLYGVCPAGPETNAQNCKTPTAHVFDLHDKGLTVTETIALANLDGESMDEHVASINFGK